MEQIKECSICKEIKAVDEFYSRESYSKKRGSYIYYHPYCKSCSVEKAYKWKEENPEKFKNIIRKYENKSERKEKAKERSKASLENGYYKKWQTDNKDKTKQYNQQRWSNKKHNISEKEWKQCKEYFDYKCAYCGMNEEDHRAIHKQQLHKEHVIHEGRNDIKNCVPSCKSCNSSKHTAALNEWYNDTNPVYTKERYLKIYQWLRWDCKSQ